MNFAEPLKTIADNVPKVYQAGYDDGVAAGGGGANPSEIVENLPIALDFSDGDQEIVAPDGVLVKSAIIQKPETLNPENIAEGVNIAGIVGTMAAGGGAGGGGALPAGLYLSASDIPNPTSYRHKRFMLNGELYASCFPGAGSGYLRIIYKWNGTAWETLLQSSSTMTDVIGGGMDSVTWKGVEYNGKLHMNDSKNHYVFDGATLVRTTDFPDSAMYICVCGGKLYANTDGYRSSVLYEWDDDNSTWITVATFSSSVGAVYSYGDQLYFISSGTVQKYVDRTLISWGTAPMDSMRYLQVGDELYGYSYAGSGYTEWYRVNLETMTYTKFGKHPTFYEMYPTVNADALSFTACTGSSNSRYPFFVLNVGEETE